MLCSILTSVILLWNIYCSLTKTVVKLLYKECGVGVGRKSNKTIAGVKYDIDGLPFWIPTPSKEDVYTIRAFKLDPLTPHQIYNHMDCYGVESVQVLGFKEKALQIFSQSVFTLSCSVFFNSFIALILLILICLSNSRVIQSIYIRLILFFDNKRIKWLLQYPFESMQPCDDEIYTINKPSLLMLEHCNHDYAIDLHYPRYKGRLNHLFNKAKLGKADSTILNLKVFGSKHSIDLKHDSTFYGGLILFEFQMQCGRFFVKSSALIEDISDASQIMENALRNLLTGVFYGNKLKSFDKIRDGSVHKKSVFNCNDFHLVHVFKKVLVKGYIDVDSAINSMLADNSSKTEMDISCVRNIIEYANIFFHRDGANRDFVKNLLRSLKTLIVNKCGRNLNMMPNSAWKRFSSDCGWMSNLRCKGLDYKKPSDSLLKFAESKDIKLTDPKDKFYHGKDLHTAIKKTKDTNQKREYFNNVRSNGIDLGNVASKFKSDIKPCDNDETPNTKIYQDLVRSVPCFDRKPVLEDEVSLYLSLVYLKPTKETYKSQLLRKIKESEAALVEGQKQLRDKSIPGVQKREIKLDIPMHQFNIRSSHENIKLVERNEHHKINNFKFVREEGVKVYMDVEKKHERANEIVLFNSFDILSRIESEQKNVKGVKVEIHPQTQKFIDANGGVKNARKIVSNKVKEVTGIDCDAMLEEKVRLYLRECLMKISKKRLRSRSGFVSKYCKDLSKTDFIKNLICDRGSLEICLSESGIMLKKKVLTECFKAMNCKLFESMRVTNGESVLFRLLESILINE